MAYVLICVIIDGYLALTYWPRLPMFGDALSWWTISTNDLYGAATRSMIEWGAFRYSPIVGQVFAPLSSLPWLAYVWLLTTVQVALIVAMGRRRWWLVLIFPGTLLELWAGNIHLALAAITVFGTRWPALWAGAVLTKITPGVGIVWFLVRREWRKAAIAVGCTAALAVAGILIAPNLWAEWARALGVMSGLQSFSPFPPLVVRLPFAIAAIAWGARTDRLWLLPVGVFLALPTIYPSGAAVLAGSVALWGRGRDVNPLRILRP
ncbi:MAG: DUF2029 domain-containing protein [Chloroflexota bacterium]|nr:DUF2029 domain-containing protein [Chloroflexota bacterium]